MGLLTKDQILSKYDLKKEEVYIPEWEASVLVSELSADARDEFEQFVVEERDRVYLPPPKPLKATSKTPKKILVERKKREAELYLHVRAPLAAATLVDENGDRLFSSQDIAKLGKKSGMALDRIFDVANRLNKIYGQEREELEKNSEAPQGDKSDGE